MLSTFAELPTGQKFKFYSGKIIYWCVEKTSTTVSYCTADATSFDGMKVEHNLQRKVLLVD